MNDVGPTLFTVAILLAGGRGSRLGRAEPKAFVEIAGKSIVRRSLEILVASGVIDACVVVIPSDVSNGEMRSLSVGVSIPVYTCMGGDTRQHSVESGLRFVEDSIPEATHIAIHDAARCLVTPDLVKVAVEAGFLHRAVTVAIPLVDSIKKVSSLVVEHSVDRSDIWCVQTPQIFERRLIIAAHAAADDAYTDDASLIERYHPVTIVEGSRMNFKITTPEDLFVAERILSADPVDEPVQS